ncbi:MAG: hypothetical protein KAT71_00105 [Gammaproteobacteria bacterium]|nr:hypothetical protein [Gammaproteobacteria bacterium]
MANNSVVQKGHKLKFTRRQLEFIRPIIIVASEMADLLRDPEFRELKIKPDIDKLIKSWEKSIQALALKII